MSKRKKILLMLAKGGVSQAGVAAALHASKRDVSACAEAIRECGLTFDDVAAMGAAEVDGMLAPPRGPRESAYLAPDMGPLGTVKILAHFPTAHRPALRCGYSSSSVTSR